MFYIYIFERTYCARVLFKKIKNKKATQGCKQKEMVEGKEKEGKRGRANLSGAGAEQK